MLTTLIGSRLSPQRKTNNKRLPAALLFFLVINQYATAEDHSIILWTRNYDTAPVDKILQLALDKTPDLLPATQIQRSRAMEYDEAIHSLLTEDGDITVLSAASSVSNDTELLAIRFPVLKGLLGYRLCLIRKNEQALFANIVTLHDFMESDLQICQGSEWPDTAILRRNGLPLATSQSYSNLFDMLSNKQCDCFLRGAQEIIPERDSWHTQFEIEKSLVLFYAQPGFFYVNKSNPQLAARIELGLLRALDDGSYHQLFSQLMGAQLEELDLENRAVLQLANPIPSDANISSQKMKKLWYSL